MGLYLYCLSDELTADAIEQVTGIAGASVRLIGAEGVIAVVSDFDGARIEVTRENVLSHDGVIRRVLARTTPLPFRFGALATRSQLDDYVNQNRARLVDCFDRVRGAVEMSVKILWDAEAQKREAFQAAEQASPGDAGKPGPGAAFLQRKRSEIAGSETVKKQAEEIAAWLANCVGDAAREAVVRVSPTEALVVRAAHLVDRARLAQYRERLNGARGERSDIRFLTSGAWPPYSFCEMP